MTEQDSEARRLAEQRRKDLDAIRERDTERERAQGKREGLEEAHTTKQDDQIANLQKVMDDLMTEFKTVNAKLTEIDKDLGEWAAVAKALAEKGVSSRAFGFGVGVLLVPLIVLLITLAVTGK